MSSQARHKKSSYSLFYIIYRRLRFVRYKNKLNKKTRLALKRTKQAEERQLRASLKEFQRTEKLNRQLKLKAEREEAGKLRKELKAEFRLRKQVDRQEWESLTREEKMKQKLELGQEKKERKKKLKQDFKLGSARFVEFLRSINYTNFKRRIKTFMDNAPKRRRFLLIAFNSTVLFLLSYLSLFIVSQAATVIAASFFDYPTIVYYYEIYFNIGQESWFHDSVKTIFSAGPLVNFVLGISLLIIYTNINELTGGFKLFFLWAFLHAVNMLFGALLVGTLFETGVGHVISWMYIMDTGKVLYSIISIFLLVIAGLITTKQFLISGNTYYNEINKYNRTPFIFAQVVMPYLAGNSIMFFIRQPRFVFYDTFIGIALFISIIPILATYSSYNELYFEEEEKRPGIIWVPLAALAFLLLIFRGLLEIGLRFSG